mmetsp:Transcript_8196/g.33735  ORF Transcript_8196/g.33735 Transcript_8196/m.33735 type:complete len:324 (-) Transcript_8196:561-1532(-)
MPRAQVGRRARGPAVRVVRDVCGPRRRHALGHAGRLRVPARSEVSVPHLRALWLPALRVHVDLRVRTEPGGPALRPRRRAERPRLGGDRHGLARHGRRVSLLLLGRDVLVPGVGPLHGRSARRLRGGPLGAARRVRRRQARRVVDAPPRARRARDFGRAAGSSGHHHGRPRGHARGGPRRRLHAARARPLRRVGHARRRRVPARPPGAALEAGPAQTEDRARPRRRHGLDRRAGVLLHRRALGSRPRGRRPQGLLRVHRRAGAAPEPRRRARPARRPLPRHGRRPARGRRRRRGGRPAQPDALPAHGRRGRERHGWRCVAARA